MMHPASTLSAFCALLIHGVAGIYSSRGPNTTLPSASTLLENALDALGGRENLDSIRSVTYSGERIFRTKLLMQSYTLGNADSTLSTTGGQNITFSYQDGSVKQRIDRFHELDQLWIYARPQLEPIDYSLVVKTEADGYACIVEGSYSMVAPQAPPSGYTDGFLAAYLIHEAHQWSPLLLNTILKGNTSTATYEQIELGQQLPAVHDSNLNLTVIFDKNTNLPRVIRSYEEHPIYGTSMHDLVVYNYTSIEGVMFPRRFKQVYNNKHILLDYLADQVVVNAELDPTLFDGSPGFQAESNAPSIDSAYDFSEISEFSSFYSWAPYKGTLANLSATQPFEDLPGLWVLNFRDGTGYHQEVLELDETVIVLDAPPHQSQLVLQWVEQTLGKSVTHVWPSHHHHDHSMGLRDYVSAGVTVITLDEVQSYYANIPGVQFVTYSSGTPLTFNGTRMQVDFVHIEDAIHAVDQSYALALPACRAANSSVAVFEADYWAPGGSLEFDQEQAMELVSSLARDGVAKSAEIIAAHGPAGRGPLQDLIDATGFAYPDYSALDYKFGSSSC